MRDRIAVATGNLTNARNTLSGLQLEQRVGTATALDVAQQQSLVDSEDASIPALRAQLSHNVAALAILLATTTEKLQLSEATLEQVAAPPVTTGLPAGLLARRPDVAYAEAQLVAANADVRAARAAFFPTIQLTAGGGVESLALSTLLEPGSRIFDLSAGLTQPLFEGGQISGAYAQSKGRYRELLADYHKAVISAFDNTQDALTQVHEIAEQLARQERATETARRAYDFAQRAISCRNHQHPHCAHHRDHLVHRAGHPGAGAARPALRAGQPLSGARRRLGHPTGAGTHERHTMNHPLRWLARPRVALAAAVVLIALVMIWSRSRHGAQAATDRAAMTPAVAVDAATVARRDVPGYLQGLGTVQAFYTVKVTARVDGQLDTVAFVEGETLKKGQLLAQIDPRPFRAALDQALAQRAKDEAQLTNMQHDLDRYLELAPQDLASKQTVDTQRASVAQAQAQLKGDDATIENARTQLSYTTITAPINGRTGIRQVDPGNIVHATDTPGIVVMTQLQPISVMFTLPEDQVPQMTEALDHGPVSVVALARDNGTVLDSGTVALLDNQIDQTTGTIRVKATFPNAHLRLWPGEFVSARVLVQMHKQALTMPAAALQRGADGMFAFVVNADSTVAVRALKVTLLDENTVIVDSGLSAGERVVTSNLYRLQPGTTVRINGASAGRRPS